MLVMTGCRVLNATACRWAAQRSKGRRRAKWKGRPELCKMILPVVLWRLAVKESSSRACQGNLAPVSLPHTIPRRRQPWRVL
ncbi:hypothetical protein M438DRAFT_208491 [Aureobasidium pullulans EXF-150]|uniref:Uncharacterized protein n=1 Tax=Aureobasidium pullulans EXF-150 TaxID=1043002 RepID=A0A074YEA3_AURPU|nr:uncharacterized protein M438DRAFT_208491 [Aureobasidium pullulans EXF-150]KEQ85146.1 hypothetical protein M438DRAFT_208491 [Aureobasidium pullulans EXF-150]